MAEPVHAKRVSRKWLYVVWGIAAALMLAYYGLWRYAGGEMETAVESWIDDQRNAGLIVEHGHIRKSGFPFFLRVNIDDPLIEAPGAWRWNTQRLSLDALPYDLNRLIFSPAETQTFVSTEIGAWTLEAEDFRASIASDDVRDWVFSVTIANARAISDDNRESKMDSLVFDLSPGTAAPDSLVLSLAASGIEISNPDSQPGYSLDTVQTVMTLSNVAALSGGDISAWSQTGGALEIGGLNAVANEAALSLAGTLSLDGASRPSGILQTELSRPAGLAPLISVVGGLTQEEADAAAAGLALAAMSSGGKISAPIEFRDGLVLVAGIKLAELEPLTP